MDEATKWAKRTFYAALVLGTASLLVAIGTWLRWKPQLSNMNILPIPPLQFALSGGCILFLAVTWFLTVRARNQATALQEPSIDAERFSVFMGRGQELHDRLVGIRTPAELPTVQSDVRQWVRAIIVFLKESRLHTEAMLFSQIASRQLSPEQLAGVREYQDWKQYDLAILGIYRHYLEHIKQEKRI
jgi:hypothetical protein